MQHNNVAVLTLFYAAVVQVPTIVFAILIFFPVLLFKGCSISKDYGALKLRQALIKAQNPCNITNHRKRGTKIVLSCLDNN